MGIESSILFSIGSKKGVGGFTEMKSAIDLLGAAFKKVQEVSKELDKFSVMWKQTNQAAVMAADAAAGGLIDTTEVMRGYNKIIASGAEITEEQFKTITARAAQMAQVTGEDATSAFKRLASDISKGTTRSIKEYGVSIKTSTDLTKTQKAAIEGLTDGYEGMTVQAKTFTERMFVLDNNLGTIAGLLYDSFDASQTFAGGLDTLNRELATFAGWMADAPEATTDFITSMKGLGGLMAEMAAVIAEPFIQIERAINDVFGIEGPGTLEQQVNEIVSSVSQPALEDLYVKQGKEKKKRDAAGIGKGDNIRKRGRGRAGSGGKSKGGGRSEADVLGEFGEGFSMTDSDEVDTQLLEYLIDLDEQKLEQDKEAHEFFLKQKEEEQEARERLLELSKEEEEQKQEAREKELEDSKRLRESWVQTYDQISAGAQKQNKWVLALSKGISASVKAVEADEKNAGAAITNVLADVGGAISDEAGWQVLMETAKALAALASQNYPAAAMHGAAAAAYGVAAAAAGSGSKGNSVPKESTAAKYADRFAGSDVNAGAGNDTGGNNEVTISIQMKEGAGGFFDAIVEQNDEACIDGRRSFTGN